MATTVLFDWTAGGHRPTYVRRFVEALTCSTDVVLALPQETLDALTDLDVQAISLGEPRPPLGGRLRRRPLLAKEAALFRDAAARGDHALHLYADHVLPRLVVERRLPSRTSLLLYSHRWHYPKAYGTNLPVGDQAAAFAKECALWAWRRRRDAHAIFTLDEEAVRHWAHHRGAQAHWLPEPPVAALPIECRPSVRDGCVLYGALAARKGIDLLAGALALEPTRLRLVLAGSPDPQYMPELRRHAATMSANGVDVDVRAYHHSELQGLQVLAGATSALLPYPSHSGMSRVLLEASSVGTPVIVHEFGLLGHLVRVHGLGLSVDCRDPRALRTAVMRLSEPNESAAYAEALSGFSSRFSPDRFRGALLSGLGLHQSGHA